MMDTCETIRARARRLFAICDKEEKGFVTRRDMQRMRNEMQLEPDQLEAVFDSLDMDSNGYVTFDEFCLAFGSCLTEEKEAGPSCTAQSAAEQRLSVTEKQLEDDESFAKLMENLGRDSIFSDGDSAKALWDHFRQNDPSAGLQFEKLLQSISESIRQKQKEKINMEDFIRTQNQARAHQLESLYAEMENQIKEERQKIIEKERIKETRVKNDLQELVGIRDQQLLDFQTKEESLRKALKQLQSSNSSANDELLQLSKEKKALESQLECEVRDAQDLKRSLKELRRQNMRERRQRAAAALKVTENLAIEREGLVGQLNLLRSINMRLSDERDLVLNGNTWRGNASDAALSLTQELGNTQSNIYPISTEEGDAEAFGSTSLFNELISTDLSSSNGGTIENKSSNMSQVPKLCQLALEKVKVQSGNVDPAPKDERIIDPVRCQGNNVAHQMHFRFREQTLPSAFFKIIVIGDAGVGKTAFIRRICYDDFNTELGSTLGIDLQTRCLPVGNGRQMCLQFWDTAGQEKYRSLTRQYLRKADGIVLIYDICSEKSFRNVRHWINTVREASNEETVCILIGNKTDLAENDAETREVSAASGQRLAQEMQNGTLFFETSAQSGYLVEQSIFTLAAKLQVKQKLLLETQVVLKPTTGNKSKKTCCFS